jgi:RND superfamily putative drug exporter
MSDPNHDRRGHREPPRRGGFARLGAAVARRRWAVIGAWVVLFAAGAVLVPRFEEGLTGPPLTVFGSESARAADVLDTEFERPFAEQVLAVFESDELTIADPAYREVIDGVIREVSAVPGVAGVIGPLDPRARDQVSGEARVAAAVVGLSGDGGQRVKLAPVLIAAAESAATDEVRVYVTGRSPLIADMVRQQEHDLTRAELRALPVALIVLLLASGTLVAAGLPLLLALGGMTVAFGLLGAASSFATFNLFVPNLATMLGLGVGIDYALFLIARYREELAAGRDPTAAVASAVATSGKTVFFSGATVVLSLASLFLVEAQVARELAVGAIVAVCVMVAGALTLLPAALALLGRRVERLALPWERHRPQRPEGEGVWVRWAGIVMRRPGRWALAATVLLLAFAAPVTGIELGLSTSTNELSDRSAVTGRAVLAREFNEGRVSPAQVVVVSPDGPFDNADLDAVARLTEAIGRDPAVADVISVTGVLDKVAGNHAAATLGAAAALPRAVQALGPIVNFGRGLNVTIVNVVPYAPPDADAALDMVRRIRGEIVPRTTGGSGLEVLVGGYGAQIIDITDESLTKLPLVAAAVVALSFLLLAVVFRSLLLPLKAILLNGLSLAAAYGLVVVVFQRSPGEGILYFLPTGDIQVYLPLLTFAVLFGLSMDYEVFLLGRIKEEWERTGDGELAVAHGLARTGRVITSAAAIMVAVFISFTVTRLPEVQQLGFSLAVAVFLDATLVRLLLVPAAMQLMGHWNWWFPAWLDRITPRVDLSEGAAEPVPALVPAAPQAAVAAPAAGAEP